MSDVRIVLGKRGMGKSTRLVEMLKLESRFILFNTLGEECYEVFETCRTFKALCEVILSERPCFQINYRGIHDGLSTEQDFDFCTRLILQCQNVVFAVDEIDQHQKPISLPQSLENIVSLGRHQDISFWCATRRAHLIHPLIRSQANEIHIFHQWEPRDIEWLKECIGNRAYEVPNLPKYCSIIWRDTDGIPIA